MKKILSAIKCQHCKDILESPVVLPCGHSICDKHFNNHKGTIICIECEIDHEIPKNGISFPPNFELTKLLESEIGNLDFGIVHKDAKESCEKLDDLLNIVEHTLNDPFNFIYEAIEYLKNVVQLKGDSPFLNFHLLTLEQEMKLKNDGKMKRYFTKLDEYKNECKSKLNSSEYFDEAYRLEQEKDSCREQLNEWLDILDEIKLNESEWKRIKVESEKKMKSIQNELARFKVYLLLQKRYGEFRNDIEKDFGKFEIDPAFNLM
jgi:hypothetical protein